MQIPPSASEFYERYYFTPHPKHPNLFCYEKLPEETELDPPSDNNSDIECETNTSIRENDAVQDNKEIEKSTRDP